MMKIVKLRYCKFFKNESGAQAIEYGLIAGGIALAIMASVSIAGGEADVPYNRVATALDAANNAP